MDMRLTELMKLHYRLGDAAYPSGPSREGKGQWMDQRCRLSWCREKRIRDAFWHAHLELKRRSFPFWVLTIWCLWTVPTMALADIAFEDVTDRSGIRYVGLSYGAAWGEFNGDGWPDLWTGNHFSAPSLYLNSRDGTFVNVADKVVSADKSADKHGVAWADFDNDGDQDLIQSVGAVMGTGIGPKQLLVNENGQTLKDEAARLGADYPMGRGRTPVWVDADNDGHLDLLLMNVPRPDGKASSVILQQTSVGFREANERFKFSVGHDTRLKRVLDMFNNLLALRFHLPRYVRSNEPFAQLADLSGEGHMDLLAYARPSSHIYALGQIPFVDLTGEIGLGVSQGITDAAIEDFNGDGQLDFFFTHAFQWVQWHLNKPTELWLAFSWDPAQDVAELSFRANGRLNFELQPFDVDFKKVFLGADHRHPDKLEFSLSPLDMSGEPSASPINEKNGFLAISYQSDKQLWTVRGNKLDVGVVVRSAEAIEPLHAEGFREPEGVTPYTLMMKKGANYSEIKLPESAANSSCLSVTAGDYDNDMDIDLYAVCTGPARQEPNLLLENDGKGNFHRLPDSGGASGGGVGRGDVVVAADYDRDGFLDLMVTNGSDMASPLISTGPHLLYHNTGNRNHWVEFDLEGRKSNRDGIGSTVEIQAGGVVQKRQQVGGMHRSAQDHQRIHFGLGNNARVDRVTVRWPSGIVQELQGLDADHIVKIVESSGG